MSTDDLTIQLRPKLKIFTDGQIRQIHSASLKILKETGVVFHEPEAIEILCDAGAELAGEKRVKIPSFLVEEAINSCPSQVTIWDRNGRKAMELEGNKVYFGTGSDTPATIDVHTGERRKVFKKDIGNVAKACDYLKNLDFVMCMGIASDVPEATSDLHHFEEMLKNTVKPIAFTAWSLENIQDIYEMCLAVAGGEEPFRNKPFAINYSIVTSPLQHSVEATQKLLFCAEKDLPVIYVTGGVMGGSLPATVAGAAALTNAENLSGLVLHQLKRKGARIIGGGSKSPMDMRTAIGAHGGPEASLIEAVQAELSSFYDIPYFGKGGTSDSKIFDQQVAIEATQGLLIAALSGINLIHDVGYMESGLTSSIDSIVMCNEIIGMVKRILRGVQLTDDTLAAEVVNQEGPGGNFLMTDHTLRHFRTELWEPELLDRNNYGAWKEKGGERLSKKINEKARAILKDHTASELSEAVKKKIENIIKAREDKLI